MLQKFLKALGTYLGSTPTKIIKVGLAEFEATVRKVREAGETPTRGTMIAITALTAALGIPVTAKEEATAAIADSRSASIRYREASKSEAAALKDEVAKLRDLITRKTATSEAKQAGLQNIAAASETRATELESLSALL